MEPGDKYRGMPTIELWVVSDLVSVRGGDEGGHPETWLVCGWSATSRAT